MFKWYFLFAFLPHFLTFYTIIDVVIFSLFVTYLIIGMLKIDEIRHDLKFFENRKNKEEIIKKLQNEKNEIIQNLKKYSIISLLLILPLIFIPSKNEIIKIFIANKLMTNENIDKMDNITQNVLDIMNNKIYKIINKNE